MRDQLVDDDDRNAPGAEVMLVLEIRVGCHEGVFFNEVGAKESRWSCRRSQMSTRWFNNATLPRRASGRPCSP